MGETMAAAVLHGPGDLRFERAAVPDVGPCEALVRVRAVGVCGSDLARVMVTGTYHFPTIPGHEMSGVVAKVGADVTTVREGDRAVVIPLLPCKRCAFCLAGEHFHCHRYGFLGSRDNGGFAEYVKAPAENLVPLPTEVSFEEGACVEPAVVSLHVVERMQYPIVSREFVVLGLGPIGSLVAQWLQVCGAPKVWGVDVVPWKLDLGRAVGLTNLVSAGEKLDPVRAILEATGEGKGEGGGGVDVVIEASGSPRALEQSFKIARNKGTVLLVGWTWDKGPSPIPNEALAAVVRKELTVAGCMGFTLGGASYDPWRRTVEAIRDRRIKVLPLISHRLPLSDAPSVIRSMFEGKMDYSRVVLIP